MLFAEGMQRVLRGFLSTMGSACGGRDRRTDSGFRIGELYEKVNSRRYPA